jgi:hypothetical protein
MMAKTIAGEMKAAFFHLSARTLATKWVRFFIFSHLLHGYLE